MLVDSHAHLISEPFQKDLDEVLNRANESGVTKIVNIATSPSELGQALKLEKNIYHAAAITPHDVASYEEEAFTFVEENVKSLVAIGETGLDYFYEHSPKEKQQEAFRRYIGLAKKHQLPLVIHCREAFTDLFRIFDEEKYQGKAVLHCFTGTFEEAMEGIKRGFFVSFSGIITFKKSESMRGVALKLPVSQILVETDCPYLAPQSRRGSRNEPAFLIETAELLANLKDLSFEKFCEITSANTKTLFNL